MTDFPAPPVPADADLRDYRFMPLDVVRLRDSAIVGAVKPIEFRAAILLWCAAWHQVPASSLPDDDVQLAKLAGYGVVIREWLKVKNGALYGFVKCSDGRFYHPVIAEKVAEALDGKQKARDKGLAGAAKRWGKENATAIQKNSTGIAQAMPENGKGEGHGKREGREREEKPSSISANGHEAALGLADLETKLREAAGWQNEPAPMLAVTGPIQALIEAGANLELDVLPTVKAKADRARSRTSWNFFVGAIKEAHAMRLQAGKLPDATVAEQQNRRAQALRDLEEFR